MSATQVILSGCSGGGKSSLLAELARRGYATVEEPGRRIVKSALETGETGVLPWTDMVAFAHRAIEIALADLAAAPQQGWVFFDRGLIDAASALTHLTGEPYLTRLGEAHRYHRRVFLTPPWPEIYETEPERRHGLADALPEYDRLLRDYPALGYAVIELPKFSVAARADFVLATLGAPSPTA